MPLPRRFRVAPTNGAHDDDPPEAGVDSLAPLSAHQGLLFGANHFSGAGRPFLRVTGGVIDGRNAPVLPGREAHNCNLSPGADGVSPDVQSRGGGRAKPVDPPTGPQHVCEPENTTVEAAPAERS